MRRQISRVVRYVVLPAGLGAAFLSLPTADARPQYHGQFTKSYPAVAAAAESKKCGVCHGMGAKTERNAYGAALGAALSAKNVKDEATLVQALKAAESKPSGVEGKTFGQLLEEGKLPE